MSLLLFLAAAAEPTPLATVTPWNVQYADNACVLSRDFGGMAKSPQVGLAARPVPLSGYVEMIVATSSLAGVGERGGLTVEVGAGAAAKVEKARYVRFVAADGRWITQFEISSTLLAEMAVADITTIDWGRGVVARLRTGAAATGRALKAIEPCQNDLLRTWGIDGPRPGGVAESAVPIGGLRSWFSESDYPSRAIMMNQRGRTTIAYRVGSDGRASDCRLLTSSGTRELDLMACAVVVRRGRFKPARDMEGMAIETYRVQRVTWDLDNN